jgi:outer membrane protein assembly factor BamB
VRGVAGDGGSLIAAIGDHVTSRGAHVWNVALPGTAGPVARTGNLVIASASAKLRGDPGALVIALDAATGAEQWKMPIDATGWSVITAIAPVSDGVIVGGSFQGTLRAGPSVVASAGQTDGFVARISVAGTVVWLERFGGPGADAIQGVAASGDTIAIAGTFSPAADLLGEPLNSIDEQAPYADAFAAVLDGNGARRWVTTFGGKLDDAVAGVAIDADGRVVVAGTARGDTHVGPHELTPQRTTQAMVVWLTNDSSAAMLLDADGASAIVGAQGHVVVGGYTQADAVLTALDAGRELTRWSITGPGREDVTALSAIPGGFVAAIAHTGAATIDGTPVPAPADPMTGATLIVR